MTEKGTLNRDAARYLRRDLKSALTDFAAGKGGTFQLLNQIERIVKYVCNDPDIALGKADSCMRKFIEKHAHEKIKNTGLRGVDWDRLYGHVKNHRNDIAHTGTEAALAGARIATLTTILLDALLHAGRKGDTMEISEVMVANPTCAEDWQTLADLRRNMLVNDFSMLPLRNGKCGNTEKWQVVRAEELAAYLLGDKKRCKETLGCARRKGLKPHCTMAVCENKKVEDLQEEEWKGKEKGTLPSAIVVIAKDKHHLVGIVTAFDLL